MQLNEYQEKALSFRLKSANQLYALHNLAGEVGELMSLEAKVIRDGESDDYWMNKKKELGDILWHIAAIAHDGGWSLQEIAQANIDKLTSRKTRNKITGSGDER